MNTKKIIILAAAVVVIAAAGFSGYKIYSEREVYTEVNVTLFRCFLGKDLTEADIGEIKEVLAGAVGDKVLDISIGIGVLPQNYEPTGSDGEKLNTGDGITVTFSVLDDEEKLSVFNALADKYGITPDYLWEGLGKDIYRADYDR
jgi:hypothetical protein